MKLSELKKQIEDAITEILSEIDTDRTRGTAVVPIGTDPTQVKKYTDKGIDVEFRKGQMVGETESEDDDDDSSTEKEPTKAELKKLEKELGSKNKKRDEIISAYKKIAGDIKAKAKAANSGDKEAKAWILKHQDTIKAYNKLKN